jgi:holo-[acyl-carrier protein] synthase
MTTSGNAPQEEIASLPAPAPEALAPPVPPAGWVILGVGVDIVETARIERVLGDKGERFRKKLFTDEEIRYCDAMPKPFLHYAARFAAKEAFSKALGTGLAAGVRWRDIGVAHLPGGQPVLRIEGKAAEILRARGGAAAHLSLSHADSHSVAVVVLERAFGPFPAPTAPLAEKKENPA